MPHYAAFHLGLHCLQKYMFEGIQNEKDLCIEYLIFTFQMPLMNIEIFATLNTS